MKQHLLFPACAQALPGHKSNRASQAVRTQAEPGYEIEQVTYLAQDGNHTPLAPAPRGNFS